MKIALREGGLLPIPAGLLKRFRLTVDAVFALVAPSPRMMWLIQGPEDFTFKADFDKVRFCGQVAGMGVADLFSMLNMGQRTGALSFLIGGFEKTVFFENGEILFAKSTSEEDRLGAVLIKLGKLTEGQLREAEKSITGGRFGNHLVQSGFLSNDDLYEVIRHQVEEIIFSLFTLQEGVFIFFEGIGVDQDLVQFSLNTQNLLMEGFQRVDEWALMKKSIPSDAVIASRTEKELPEGCPRSIQRALEFVDGSRSVKDVMRAASLGSFVTHKALYDSERLGLVTLLIPKEQSEKTGSEKLIQDFNRLFRTVANEIKSAGESDLERAFSAFANNLPKAVKDVLLGVPIRDDGTIDEMILMTRVRDAVKKKGGSKGMAGMSDIVEQKTVLNALNETLNFFLFTAKSSVPKAKADRLIAAIRNVHKNLLARVR